MKTQQSPHQLLELLNAPDPKEIHDVLEYLQRIPGYPYKENVDPPFIEELIQDFPKLSLIDEIKDFRWYYENDPAERIKNIRLGIRRWLTNSWTWR